MPFTREDPLSEKIAILSEAVLKPKKVVLVLQVNF
jgi:hypothetical protein